MRQTLLAQGRRPESPVDGLSVTVAAYGTFETAAADWDDLDRCQVSDFKLLDAVLIERDEDRVVTLHRFSTRGWGYGWIASALVGVLWPPSLLTGAVAGGVGANVITCISRGLSREDACELGRVLESGPFVTLLVTDHGFRPITTALSARALRVARFPMGGTERQLRDALKIDAEEP